MASAGMVETGKYFGAVQGSLALDDLTVTETSYADRMHVPAHAHGNALMCAVVRGGFLEHSWRAARPCDEGSVLFHPSHAAHAHDFYPTTSRCITVTLGPRWIAAAAEHVRPRNAPRLLTTGRAGVLTRLLHREVTRGRRSSTLALEAIVCAMLTEVSGDTRRERATRWVPRVVEYLRWTFREPVRLTDLAAIAGVHPTHLSRGFRGAIGLTLTQYVTRLRVDYASKLLRETDLSQSVIAADAGFADESHFIRRFTAILGTTPGRLRSMSDTRSI